MEHVIGGTTVFEPCIWGNFFLTHTLLSSATSEESQQWMHKRTKQLIEEVVVMIRGATTPTAKMDLIDALQRLGIDYHFEQDINQELFVMHKNQVDSDDLHTISLQFRLLRQKRYNVSSDIFKKFTDEQGKFQASLANNAKGLLSLYDAAYLGTPQDKILDEAIEFAGCHLKAMVANLNPILAQRVLHSLKSPLHRRMTRLEARLYISIYEEDEENCKDEILELAKLDFHLLQMIHQEELRSISLWWKELALSNKLKFARDRVVECYFWMLGLYHEPQYSKARIITTKMIIFLSLFDDTFDSYGTISELQQYNEVIQRWDLEAVHELDENLRLQFIALRDTFKDMEKDLINGEKMSYRIHSLREMVKEAVGAWFEEARLKEEGRMLKFDEYLPLSLKTTAYPVLACASFVGMGDVATKDVFDWVSSYPRIVMASTAIVRLTDDVADFELDTKRNHIFTNVYGYAKEHGTSTEIACKKLVEMAEEEWKAINQETLTLALPTEVVMRIVNLARMSETIFNNGDGFTGSLKDGYTHPLALKDHISLLLVEPISF